MALGLFVPAMAPAAAWAQSTSAVSTYVEAPDTYSTLVAPVLPPDYTRGHNVGVLEEWHPEYESPGQSFGSFVLRSQATIGLVGDNNIYSTGTDRISDISAVFKPNVSLSSDWSRHSLSLQTTGDLRRYMSQPLRDQNSWSLKPAGELDLGKDLVLHLEGHVGEFYESPFTSDLAGQSSALSHFFRSGVIARATYTLSRVRLTGSYEHSSYSFATLFFPNGQVVSQRYRDRTIDRFSGQAEYAISPSLAVYGALSGDFTTYEVAANAQTPKQSSTGENLIGGVSFDLAGVMRGVVGVGFTHRSYIDPSYKDVQAFSFQARMDFFPWKMTNFSLGGQRLIQDSALGTTPYIDTRLLGSVSHSFRENIVGIVGGAVGNQAYVGSSGHVSFRQFQASLQYQASRWLGFRGEFNYRSGEPSTAALGIPYNGSMIGLSSTVRW